jgi:O-antigen/teichoic acid export membrane protein
MSLGDRIRSGVQWLLVGNVGNQLLQFAFGIVLARLLVPADFGMIVTIQVLTGFVGMFASGGMGQSLIRAKEADANDFYAVFTMQLSLGILIYAGFFLSAHWIAEFFKDPLYDDLLKVSALSFILRPFSLIRVSWLNRQMDFKKRSLIDLAGAVLAGALSILMAAAGMGVWSLTLSGLAGGVITWFMLSHVTPLRLRLRFDVSAARKHSAYGLKTTASDFLTYLIEQSVNLILSRLAGPGFVGLYNKAESLARMPNRLITPPTGQTVFRAMSKVQDDLDKTKYMFYRTITLLMVYIFPCLIGLWWIAEPFVRLIYGDKWLPCVEPMRIMILIGFLRTVATPCGVLLAAQNRLNQQLIAQSISLATTVAACLIGLRWGLAGVAWAAVGTAAIFTTYAYVLAYRTISTRLADLFNAALPALLLNALLFVVLTVVHVSLPDAASSRPWVYLPAMCAAGVLTYTCAFLFLPIPALRTEVERWRARVARLLGFKRKPPA